MKNGSFLMMGLEGESLTLEEKYLLEKEGVGGVILFERNCRSYLQLKGLLRELYQLRLEIPLIIAIDREGGVVDRLKKIKEFFPWPHVSLLTKDEIEPTSYFLHQELRHIGINMNLTPCLDISNEKSSVLKGRTFSKNPIQTAQMGKAFIQGARRAGVLSCAKHFPGHGGVSEDSHLMLPVDSRKKEKVLEFMLSFRQSISHQVEGMMLSHLLYPSLDPDFPAPLSYEIVHNLLRVHLGFSGLILTDDLDMKAVNVYTEEKFVEKSLNAGVNMMICGQNRKKVFKILDFLNKQTKMQPVLKLRGKELMAFKKKYLTFLCPSFFPSFHPERSQWFKKVSH